MAFAICGTETVTIVTFFLLWQGLTSDLMFNFLISTNIVNKKGNFRNKVYVYPQIIFINVAIAVKI